MAGYQRFVAYVYEYRKGKKDSSSGYVRVEARDRKCRVEVGNAVWRFICAALDWSLEVGAECMGLCGRKG